MRLLYLGLAVSTVSATLLFAYCFYLLTSTIFAEVNYNMDLETRLPSILPMSAIIQWHDPFFNTTQRAMGRYAAFGPIVPTDYPPTIQNMEAHKTDNAAENSHEVAASSQQSHEDNEIFEGNLYFVKDNACNVESLEAALAKHKNYDAVNKRFLDHETIILNERGGCSFYEKIINLQEKNAKAVLIGNDQYNKGLLTMFSKTMPENVTIPSIFITKETLNDLHKLIDSRKEKYVKVLIFTGQTPSPLLDALLTIIFSPPIALSVLYVILKTRRSHRSHLEKAPKKAVKNLPVYVYNANYLIPIAFFEKHKDYYLGPGVSSSPFGTPRNSLSEKKPSFLKRFGSVFLSKSLESQIPDSSSDSIMDIIGGDEPSTCSNVQKNKGNLNITESDAHNDDKDHLLQHHLSIEELNQYQIVQCSICLNQFRKLKSKVILLPCNHYFHYKCCLNWLCNYKKLCPICKHDITKKIKRKSTSSARQSFSASSIARSALAIFSSSGNEDMHTSSAPVINGHHSHSLMVERGTSPGVNYNTYGTSANLHSLLSTENVIDQAQSPEVALDDVSDVSVNDVDYIERTMNENEIAQYDNYEETVPLLETRANRVYLSADEERSIENGLFQ